MTTIGFEEKLWQAADKLRGSMDAAEYKNVALGLIFLKYVSDSFEEKYEELKQDPYADEEDQDEYLAENIFWVPKEARWQYINDNAKKPEIGQIIDKAMIAIENENDAYLTKFPGIGKKTARQIVLDLKGKVKITEETSETLLQVEGQVEENDNIIKEALLALAALGYSKRELSKVEKVLNKTSIHSVDEAVKIGLKTLVS